MTKPPPPFVVLWADDTPGGAVTRCDDPERARELLKAHMASEYGYDADEIAEISEGWLSHEPVIQWGRWSLAGANGEGYYRAWREYPGPGKGITRACLWIGY